jgi:hypothetical protein
LRREDDPWKITAMKTRIIIFVTGLVLGGAVVAAWLTANKPSAPVADDQRHVRLQRELDTTLQRNRKLEEANNRLTMEVLDVKSAVTKPAPATDSVSGLQGELVQGDPKIETDRITLADLKRLLEPDIKLKMMGLKLRCGLTAEQEQKVQSALLDRELREITNDLSEAEQKELPNTGKGSENESLQKILTPEQYAAFQQYQAEERRTEVETSAHLELGELQGPLQLTESQKDQVFRVLYQYHDKQGDIDDWNSPAFSGEVLKSIEQAKKDALQQVLTSEQLKIYQEIEKQNAEDEGEDDAADAKQSTSSLP